MSPIAITFLASLLLAVRASAANTWTEAEKHDPLHRISFREFSLEGHFLIPPEHGTLSAPLLVLRCQPGLHRRGKIETNGHFIQGWIDTGAVLDSAKDVVAVEYRLDDKKLQSDEWAISNDRKGMFLNELLCGDCNVNILLFGHFLPHKEGSNPQVRRIVMGVREYLGDGIQLEFDLPDSSDVAEACGVIVHKAK